MNIKSIVGINLYLLSISCLFAQTETDCVRKVYEAIAMIQSEEPEFQPYIPKSVDPQLISDLAFEQPNRSESVFFTMEDGPKLHANKYACKSGLIALVLHGIMGSSYNYNKMAGLLRETLGAEVYALDLRGHGRSEGTPGDTDYIDQYAYDIKQVIEQLKKDNPQDNIILVGHSMGGGIALQYAMLPNPEVKGFLLFAPHLGHNAPTVVNAQDDTGNDEPFLKIHLNRIIGISVLNSYGIHDYDSLAVLYFNVPENAPIRTYSYRSNLSMAPTDYKEALNAINKPMLILVGSEDEAFSAPHYQSAVRGYANIEFKLIEGASHNGVRHEPIAIEAVKSWSLKHGIAK